jgi:hypothetical protein
VRGVLVRRSRRRQGWHPGAGSQTPVGSGGLTARAPSRNGMAPEHRQG